MAPFVVRSLGGAVQEARQGGADLDQQLLYGSAQAAKEFVTEKLFGLAVPQKALGKAGTGSLDDAIEKGIRNVTERLAQTEAGKKALGGALTWLGSGVTEGLEEGIGALIENTLISPNLREWDPDGRTAQEKFQDGLYDMLVGGVSGLMGVTNLLGYQTGAGASKGAARQAERGLTATQTDGAGTGTPAAENASRGPVDMGRELDRFMLKETEPQTWTTETQPQGPGESDFYLPEQLKRDIPEPGQQESASEARAGNRNETVRVVQRLQESIPLLSKEQPVSTVSSHTWQTIEGATMAEKARKLFNGIKGLVTRHGFGTIEINSRSMKDDLSHGIGPAKAAVIPAIPSVLQNGLQIDFQENWKGRPYNGYIFAAPVVMDGTPVYVAAVVKRTSKNRFYLHEVVDSNGNIIKISSEERANPTSLAADGDAGTQSSLPSVGGTSSLNTDSSIAQDADSVNTENDGLGGGGPGINPFYFSELSRSLAAALQQGNTKIVTDRLDGVWEELSARQREELRALLNRYGVKYKM